jgi:hypothetical protein
MPITAAPPSRTLVALANAIPNVFWSVLSIVPLSFFCYHYMSQPWLYSLLLRHLLVYGIPMAWFSRWQLSRTPARYRQLGVPAVGRLTQHGEFVNRFIRHHYPRYCRVRAHTVAAVVRASYQVEQFHLGLFGFFLLSSLYALWHGQGGWALLIMVTNVGYNVYPIWLQQYIRVRLAPGQLPRGLGRR